MVTSKIRESRLVLIAGMILGILLIAACGSSATSTAIPATETVAATSAPANTSPPAGTSQPANTVPPSVQPTATVVPLANVAGSAQAKAIPQGKYGGTIPMQLSGNVAHWNIMECGSGGTCMSENSPLYNGVVHYNGETADPLDVRGDFATGWTVSEDGMSYVFTLPEDARWHDGHELNADDVVFSLEEMVRDDVPRPRSGQIRSYYESSVALDPFTVQVDLQFAASAFLPFLALEFMKIWPKHWVGTDPANQKDMRLEENIHGSGPFKMVEHTKDVSIKWEKNEDYFKEGLPYFDGMEYFMINDSSRVLAAYKAQQVMMTVYLNSNMNVREGKELAEAMEGKGTVYFAGPTLWHALLMNTKVAPFDDVRVRRAINLVLHRQAFNEIFGDGEYLIGSPFPPDTWFSSSTEELLLQPGLRETADGDKHPDDISEAQRLMAEAGYPDGFETAILAANFLSFPDMAQVAADQLDRWLNIKAVVQPEEPAAGYVRYEGGDWKMGFHGNGILVMDPDQILGGTYLAKGTRNYSAWEPPEVTEFFNQQQHESDIDKRREINLQIEDYLSNTGTHLAITEWAMLIPYVDNRIKNFNIASGFGNHTNKEHLWFEE
jgi:peptide/nickel transport system substrate-binding protein